MAAATPAVVVVAAVAGYSSGPRQMYPAVCSSCGKETEVPFQPRMDKPVYCRECFQDRRAASPGYGSRY